MFVGDVWGAGDEVASLTVPVTAETDFDASAGERRAGSERFPGKRVVAGCFIVLMVSSGLGFYGLAVYLNAFSRERGRS